MKRWLILFGLTLLTALAGVSQTITLNDASNAGCTASTGLCAGVGLNLGQSSGAFPQMKNLLQFANPGFEPPIVQQIFQFAVNPCTFCSATTFQWNVSNTNFTDYTANQWALASFVVSGNCYSGMTGCTGGGTADPANGCTGTIASNTAATGGFGSEFTINGTTNQGSSGCAGPLGIPGQVITISTNGNMTNLAAPSTTGWPQATLSGTVTAENTDIAPGGGTQSVEFNGASSLTLSNTAYTTLGVEKTLTLNGNYTVSFEAKSVSGSTTALTFTLTTRNGNCANPSPCTYTPTLTTSWASYSHTFALNETPSPSDPFSIGVSWAVSSGADVRMDNVALTDPSTNPTAFSDTFVNTLKAYCQSAANTTGPKCALRYGPSPDSETMANWVKTVFLAQPSTEAANSTNIQFSFGPGYFTQKPRIYDFLQLCAYVGATPVLITPVTMTAADSANLMDFLEDNAGSTTYGAIRQTLGQTTAWVGQSGSPFPFIFLEMGNENWNGLFLGHALFGHTNNPNNYFDYGVHIGNQIIAPARARQTAQGYSTSDVKFMANSQTGSTTDLKYLTAFICGQPGYSGGTITCTQGGEDGIEYQQYYATNINGVSTTNCTSGTPNNANCGLYGPTLTETWSNYYDPSSTSGAAQTLAEIPSITSCGPAHNVACLPATYERAIYPTGNSNFTQAVSDTFTQTGWHGVADGIAYAEANHNGLAYITEYASESYALSQGGVNVHIYGAFLDNGGDTSVTNASLFGGNYTPRPQMGAAEVTNYCQIGQEVQTTGSSIPTYNLGSNSNGVNAINNVPNLTFHEYTSGTQRCILINNNDIANSYSITFAGTNTPTTVTQFQQAPSSPTVTNEATNLNTVSTTAAAVYPVLTSSVNVSSGFTAPPTSTTALLFNTVTPLVAVDFGSRSGGSSIAAQTVCTNVGGLSGTNPLADIAAAGITCARVFANQLQACPSVYTSCSWSNLNSILTLVTGAGFTSVILNIVGTSPDLGASGCAPPSSAANWATAVQSMIADVTTNYPTLKISLEIGNEYDLGTVGGTYPTTFWCPPSGHTVLGDYNTLIHTAGPQIHTAYPTLPILIGVLGSPVANGSAWFNTSTGIFSSSGWSSPPSQVSASYHAYLGDAASWAAQYAQDMGSSGTANLLSTMQGLAGSVPVQVTETNTGSSFTPTPGPAYPVRNQVAYMPMWVANMYISYLNAGTVPADISFYGDQGGTGATSFFCIEGLIDTNMDCDDSSFQRYPQWYAFNLFQNLLGLNSGGNAAASISPGTNATGVTCTAFYTSTGNAFACVNPTGTAQTSQPITINNTGYGSAVATQYLLNASNPTIASSSLSLTSAGGTSYTGTVTVPANSTLGVLIQAATVTAPTRVFVLMP